MTCLYKWGELRRIYKLCNRQFMIKATHAKGKPFLHKFSYFLTMITFQGILVALFVVDFWPFWIKMLLFGTTGISAYFCLDKLIELEYIDIYKKHNLKQYPFFKRTHYLSYLLFCANMKFSTVKYSDISSLLEWDKVEKEKYDYLSIFSSPVILILLTLLSSIILEYVKINDYIKQLFSFSIFSIFGILVFILFNGPYSNNERKMHLDIRKFLRWYSLDMRDESSKDTKKS